jgi:hypothetical protein
MKKATALCLQRVIAHTPPYVRAFGRVAQSRRLYASKSRSLVTWIRRVEANALAKSHGPASFKKLLDRCTYLFPSNNPAIFTHSS